MTVLIEDSNGTMRKVKIHRIRKGWLVEVKGQAALAWAGSIQAALVAAR
jgi:hypothetical protein